MARMPEPKKTTLKAMLTAELEAVREQCPPLQVVKLAAGAKDNWTYLSARPNLSPMAKNVADLRFAVSNQSLGRSAIWRLWITRHGDLYLATRGTASHIKVSFHRSGICRYAFTKKHGAAPSMPDRVMQRWARPPVPKPDTNSFARLAWLAVPTDYLSRGPNSALSTATTVPPAQPGSATFVEIGLTRDSRQTIDAGTGKGLDRGILLHSLIFEDVAAFVRWYHGDWKNNDLRVPASHGLPAYRFMATERTEVQRPIRITLQADVQDGDALLVTELGGCLDAA